MPLAYGLVPAAAITVAVAGYCAAVLLRSTAVGKTTGAAGSDGPAPETPATDDGQPTRTAGPALAGGAGGIPPTAGRPFAFAQLAMALGLVAAALCLPGLGHRRPTVLTAAVATGASVSIVLTTAAVLLLPVVAGSGRTLLRHVLDGFVMAAGVFYVAWALMIEPMHRAYLGGALPLRLAANCLGVSAAALTGTVAVGVLAAVALKSPAARQVTLIAVGAVVLAGAQPAWLYLRSGPLTLLGGMLYASAAIGMVRAVRAAPSGPPSGPDKPHDGLGVSLALVFLAAVAALIRVQLLGRPIDPVSVATAVVIGAALAAQQALARMELRRTAARLRRSEAHFRTMAYTDPLTGLANRRQLVVALDQDNTGDGPFVLLAVDLDGFKNVNDTRGHDVGDAVLLEVARRLRTNLRPGDLAVRVGGDEFAVLMNAGPAEAGTVADRLLAVLCRPYEVAGGSVYVSASIGLAVFAAGDEIEDVIRNADVALRFAKQRGKHRVEEYDLAYDQWLRRRTELEQELRGADERGELMLVYQPVVRLADGRVVGVEALLRWHHPRLGQVPPDEFIPLAEEAGLIDGLGAFVLDEACHQLSRWLGDGHDVYLSVNVSVRELHHPEYPARIAEVLRVHRVPAHRLVVEVTEHAVAVDMQALVERLAALRAAGVRVALDDFGSGYSSLGQLRTLPVDILKIDRSLVAAPGTPAPVRFVPPLADVVVQLGRRLGLDVVAEGISAEEQRTLLIDAGCEYAQGDLFDRPMPAERVETLFGTRVGPPRPRDPGDAAVHNVGSVDSGHEMRQS